MFFKKQEKGGIIEKRTEKWSKLISRNLTFLSLLNFYLQEFAKKEHTKFIGGAIEGGQCINHEGMK